MVGFVLFIDNNEKKAAEEREIRTDVEIPDGNGMAGGDRRVKG